MAVLYSPNIGIRKIGYMDPRLRLQYSITQGDGDSLTDITISASKT